MVLASSPRNAVLVQLRRPAASDLLRMLRKPTRFRVTRLKNYARKLEALNRGLVAALDGPASSPTVNDNFEDLRRPNSTVCATKLRQRLLDGIKSWEQCVVKPRCQWYRTKAELTSSRQLRSDLSFVWTR